MIRFRFGRMPPDDVEAMTARLLARHDMWRLRHLLPVTIGMQGDGAVMALKRLIQDAIQDASGLDVRYLYNLLLLTELHDAEQTKSLAHSILKNGSGETAGDIAFSLDTVARAVAGVHAPPAILSRDRPLRVAICVSGQLRGYKTAFPSWRNFGCAPDEHSYFVHTWSGVDDKHPTLEHAHRCFSGRFPDLFRQAIVAHGLPWLEDRYPSLFAHMRGSDRVTETEVANFYGAERVVIEDDAQPPFGTLTNPERMHYKMWAAHELARQSPERFDIYIRTRPNKMVVAMDAIDWRALRPPSPRASSSPT